MLELKYIDKELLYKVLSIPSFIEKENLVRDFLVSYAIKNGIEIIQDAKGNIYMTKGKTNDGEYYPCLIAHMDTVQYEQIPYIEQEKYLDLQTEERDNGIHIIYTEGFGLGGDDKAGIVIALSIMSNLNVCKATFFVEEENGCKGSREADLTWFKDVGYIISFDSPEGNCASWSCMGELLFDKNFYENHLKELGQKFGLTKYVAHPYTDTMILRMNTSLACMNFGAGYYNYHEPSEYVVAEEMDFATAMGLYLINTLGLKEYVIPFYSRFKLTEDNEDIRWFNDMFGLNY